MFHAFQPSNLAANVSSSPLVNTAMSLAFEITDNIQLEVKKSIANDILMFIKHHREESYLLGNIQRDKESTYHIATKLWHFQLKKTLFSM